MEDLVELVGRSIWVLCFWVMGCQCWASNIKRLISNCELDDIIYTVTFSINFLFFIFWKIY